MALSAELNLVGSSNATPKEFTLQSPSFNKYQMTSTIISYGDYTDTTPPQNVAGLTANGYVNVQYHVNNEWQTNTLFTSETGAQINTLVTA
jgi:hypothetical protein